MMSTCVNAMNACICVIRAAIITPNAVSVKDSSRSSPITLKIRTGSYGTCAGPARARMAIPWKVETVGPPRHFSITIAELLTGAISFSRRTRTQGPHSIEAAEKMAVNRTDIDARRHCPARGVSAARADPEAGSVRVRDLDAG
jgi:hypothetical protein